MRLVLNVTDGPFEGRKIALQAGQSCTVGRTEWAEFTIPHDARMSGVHFSVECDEDACRVKDLHSTNGTLLNGEPTTEAALRDGDLIIAGQTTLRVTIEKPGPDSIPPSPDNPIIMHDHAAEADHAQPVAPVAAPAIKTIEQDHFLPSNDPFAIESRLPFHAALQDEDPRVVREALLAAVWIREPWLLDYCRWCVAQPTPAAWEPMWLLAVLGRPSDGPAIQRMGRNEDLGPQRFDILASFGHPAIVRDILNGLASSEEETAAAAAAAFSKVTGADDDFTSTPELAQQHWSQVKGKFAAGTRWRQGMDLSHGIVSEVLDRLDMQGRWEALLRARYEGQWTGLPQRITRFRRPRKR